MKKNNLNQTSVRILYGITALVTAIFVVSIIRRVLNKRAMKEDFDELDDRCNLEDEGEALDECELCNHRRYIKSLQANDNAVNEILEEMESSIRKEMEECNDPDALERHRVRLAATIILHNPNASSDELYEKVSSIADESNQSYDDFMTDVHDTMNKIKAYLLVNHKIELLNL